MLRQVYPSKQHDAKNNFVNKHGEKCPEGELWSIITKMALKSLLLSLNLNVEVINFPFNKLESCNNCYSTGLKTLIDSKLF